MCVRHSNLSYCSVAWFLMAAPFSLWKRGKLVRGIWLHLSFPLFCRTLTQEVGVSKTTLILCLSSVRGTEDTRIISYRLSKGGLVCKTNNVGESCRCWMEHRRWVRAGVMEDGKLDKEGVSGGVKGWHRHGWVKKRGCGCREQWSDQFCSGQQWPEAWFWATEYNYLDWM